jgi:creatinine amidohydrolase
MRGRSLGARANPGLAKFDVEPLPHQAQETAKPMLIRAAGKVALAAAVGVALASYWVRQPLTAPLPNTLQIADMTWIEVRSAIARGYTKVIVPSGGIEQNGPHMVLGKHDYIVGAAALEIARELGQTLVTPVVSFVPEGDYDPPAGHLRFPGTMGVPEDVYAGMLEGIARSLKAGGFKTICFIADHGGSLKPQAEVAQRLTREWAEQGVRVLDVSDYYADAGHAAQRLSQRRNVGGGDACSGSGQKSDIQGLSRLSFRVRLRRRGRPEIGIVAGRGVADARCRGNTAIARVIRVAVRRAAGWRVHQRRHMIRRQTNAATRFTQIVGGMDGPENTANLGAPMFHTKLQIIG